MYRVAKKTTKKTENHCLNCKYHKLKRELPDNLGTIIECTALNRCIKEEFNSKDFYCIEYQGMNEISDENKDKIVKNIRQDYSKKAFREYANKYYSKNEAKEMIKEFNETLKERRLV